MARVETVKITSDNEQGFIVINKSDMTDEFELFTNDVIAIKDMKKMQLMSFIEKNNIEIPDDVTKVDDIKLHLMGMDLEIG